MRVERVLAPNPSLFTGPGTNTYVISSAGDAIVLDPGPIIDRHLASIETALDALTPTAVIVTHTHPDHAPAANVLGARLGVPVLGHSPGPEFEPSATLADGDVVTSGGRVLCVTALGNTVADAAARAYRGVDVIDWDGAVARRDIGYRAIARERESERQHQDG